MADGETKTTQAAEAAASAAKTTTQVIENVEADAAARVENANAAASAAVDDAAKRIDDANRAAADVALGAMNTELGRRVDGVEKGMSEWQTKMQADLEAFKGMMTEQLAKASGPSSSTLTAPPVPAVATVETPDSRVQVVTPQPAGGGPIPAAPPTPPARKRTQRWI
jgi:hypothetical protein